MKKFLLSMLVLTSFVQVHAQICPFNPNCSPAFSMNSDQCYAWNIQQFGRQCCACLR